MTSDRPMFMSGKLLVPGYNVDRIDVATSLRDFGSWRRVLAAARAAGEAAATKDK